MISRQATIERARLVASCVADHLEREPAPVHPKRAHIHKRISLGERAADMVAAGLGSWRFIGLQTGVIILWITLNVVALVGRWDPYPFILLNLLFSTQAAYAAPILQLSGNRQAAKDRVRDDTEAREVEMLVKLLRQNTALTEQVAQLTREVHAHMTASETQTPRLVTSANEAAYGAKPATRKRTGVKA